MSDDRTGERRWPSGLVTALVCAGLLVASFGLATAQTTMPPGERWAALTLFTLLALAYTLQGSAGLADALGRVVRRDWRAAAALAALLPTLYTSYSLTVGEFSWAGLVTALAFAGLPTAALLFARRSRGPGLLDAAAAFYLWASLAYGLVPALMLPQQGGLVNFFTLAAQPLLLMLLAARGWPGLGFTWHLNIRELVTALAAAMAVLLVVLPAFPADGGVGSGSSALVLFTRVMGLYFFQALPVEILFRGVVQNGLARLLERRLRSGRSGAAGGTALALAALLSGLARFAEMPGAWRAVALTILIALAGGFVYWRTGKVTAAAVSHTLVLWGLELVV